MSLIRAPRSRWTAAPLHILLSLLVIGGIALAVTLLWFPAGLYRAANLGKLFEVMLLVDVVVGPLLTLFVYKPGKKGLKLDLTVIALLQFAFLGYGLHTLWKSRPVFLVGSSEAFALVFANEVPEAALREAPDKGYARFHRTGPWLVAINAESRAVKHEILDSFLDGSPGPLRDPSRFLPYAEMQPAIRAAARPLTEDMDSGGLSPTSVRFQPLYSGRSNSLMLLDAASGAPIKVVR